jgi:hypothetical protein
MIKLYILLLLGIHPLGYSAAILNKDINIPSCEASLYTIKFCVTKSLKDEGSLKGSLLKDLKQFFAVDTFIETGTFLGDTALVAAKIFDNVHTVELSPEIASKAAQRLKPWNNVVVYQGESGEILNQLLPKCNGKNVLFYLDAHYSAHYGGFHTAKGYAYTPILRELKALAAAENMHGVILIDDLRLFQDSRFPAKVKNLNYGVETYPHLEEIIRAILEIDPNYQICFLSDALLAFPKDQNVSVSPVMRACALHRLQELCADLSENEMKNADRVIGTAPFEEEEEIAVYYREHAPFELETGYRSYAALWYALILRENGHEEKARNLLKKIAENSPSNWRISNIFK